MDDRLVLDIGAGIAVGAGALLVGGKTLAANVDDRET